MHVCVCVISIKISTYLLTHKYTTLNSNNSSAYWESVGKRYRLNRTSWSCTKGQSVKPEFHLSPKTSRPPCPAAPETAAILVSNCVADKRQIMPKVCLLPHLRGIIWLLWQDKCLESRVSKNIVHLVSSWTGILSLQRVWGWEESLTGLWVLRTLPWPVYHPSLQFYMKAKYKL